MTSPEGSFSGVTSVAGVVETVNIHVKIACIYIYIKYFNSASN